MSEPTLASLPSNRLIFDDGAIEASLRAGLHPDEHLVVSEWSDRYRVLDTRSSSEAGRWRTARTPYLREIMDALSGDDPAQEIVVMAGAQIGKSESGLNWIGYVIDHSPGPMMAVQPTVDMAKRFSQQRLGSLISASERLSAKIPPARQRDSGNTVLSKEFPGGILVLTGANSAAGLRSMPARFLFLDEVDAYPGDLDGEGDPVALAEARTRTFGRRRKILMTSTPTITGQSRIEREFEQTDQRRYHVPCPHCGGLQWLKFERLQWEWGNPASVAYVCEHCETGIQEHHKTWMMAEANGAAWAPTAEPTKLHVKGYHISSLYSPVGWLSWAEIAQEWEAAQGSDDAIKAFKNGVLGETWQETGEAPDWKRLYDLREQRTRGVVPDAACFLTAGVDVQRDRLEIDIYGWGPGLESWLIDHVVIDGGAESQQAWSELTELVDRPFYREDRKPLHIKRLAIDTGYETQLVYAWARSMSSPVVMPVKGEERFDRSTPVQGPTFVDIDLRGRKIRRGARLWKIAVSTFKSETYRFLRHDRPTDEQFAQGVTFPPGFIHTPVGIGEEWFKQLTAEQLVTWKNRRGFTQFEWRKIRDRNEALDCRVYARAAAYALGADLWPEGKWRKLASAIADAAPGPSIEAGSDDGVKTPTAPRPAQDGLVRRSRPVRRRRIVRPN